jgi:hypothetical protein
VSSYRANVNVRLRRWKTWVFHVEQREAEEVDGLAFVPRGTRLQALRKRPITTTENSLLGTPAPGRLCQPRTSVRGCGFKPVTTLSQRPDLALVGTPRAAQ